MIHLLEGKQNSFNLDILNLASAEIIKRHCMHIHEFVCNEYSLTYINYLN